MDQAALSPILSAHESVRLLILPDDRRNECLAGTRESVVFRRPRQALIDVPVETEQGGPFVGVLLVNRIVDNQQAVRCCYRPGDRQICIQVISCRISFRSSTGIVVQAPMASSVRHQANANHRCRELFKSVQLLLHSFETSTQRKMQIDTLSEPGVFDT